MKKKIAIIILAIMSVLSLCLATACGKNEKNADSSSQQSITSSVENSTIVSTCESTTSSASVSTSDSASQCSGDNKYTITFCQQGQADIIKTVKSGEALTDIPTLPEIKGYEVSWDITDFNNVTRNIIVNIVKTLINYSVTYNLAGGVNSNLNPNEYNIETNTINVSNATREGYTFDGWYINETKITEIAKGSTGDKTLTAKWTTKTYTLTYENLQGTTQSNMASYTVESEVIILSAPTERICYTFDGWYINETKVKEIAKGSTGDKTLTAKWSCVYQRVDKDGVATTTGSYLLFGEYPQTIKTNDVTVSLSASANGYYLGSDNAYYAKVTANPNVSGYTFSTGDSVTRGSVYYFKVEPIRWRILRESDGTALILCDSIIANGTYCDNNFNRTIDGQTIYANNYEYSRVRAWLNDTFYETAFTDLQQELIMTTTVDNSVSSTGYDSNQYACANTQDKIFLLSYKEVTNSSYGFLSSSYDEDLARRMVTSDYTRATGVYMGTSSGCFGNGWWWLRSPDGTYSNYEHSAYNSGLVFGGNYVTESTNGIVPALKIKLS